MKKKSSTLFGILLVLIGINIIGQRFLPWHIDIFFKGWQAFIIIIPCVLSILDHGLKIGNGIGLAIGTYWFLEVQDFVPIHSLGKLLGPVILIIIGINFLSQGKEKNKIHVEHSGNSGLPNITAMFSSKNEKITGTGFYGSTLDSIFGSVNLDLRDAIITEDIVIDATALFGSININVPSDVCVKVSSTALFGAVKNHTKEPENLSLPTIFINGLSMFGGVDIR